MEDSDKVTNEQLQSIARNWRRFNIDLLTSAIAAQRDGKGIETSRRAYAEQFNVDAKLEIDKLQNSTARLLPSNVKKVFAACKETLRDGKRGATQQRYQSLQNQIKYPLRTTSLKRDIKEAIDSYKKSEKELLVFTNLLEVLDQNKSLIVKVKPDLNKLRDEILEQRQILAENMDLNLKYLATVSETLAKTPVGFNESRMALYRFSPELKQSVDVMVAAENERALSAQVFASGSLGKVLAKFGSGDPYKTHKTGIVGTILNLLIGILNKVKKESPNRQPLKKMWQTIANNLQGQHFKNLIPSLPNNAEVYYKMVNKVNYGNFYKFSPKKGEEFMTVVSCGEYDELKKNPEKLRLAILHGAVRFTAKQIDKDKSGSRLYERIYSADTVIFETAGNPNFASDEASDLAFAEFAKHIGFENLFGVPNAKDSIQEKLKTEIGKNTLYTDGTKVLKEQSIKKPSKQRASDEAASKTSDAAAQRSARREALQQKYKR